MKNYNIEKYIDPVRPLRIRIKLLAFTTLGFALLAVLATNKYVHWHEVALQWEFKALTGGQGDQP